MRLLYHIFVGTTILAYIYSYSFASSRFKATYPVRQARTHLSMSDFPESMPPSAKEIAGKSDEPKFKGFGKKDDIVVKKAKTAKELEDDQILESKIRSTTMFQKERARQEDALDTKIAALKEEEDLIATDPSVGAVPEVRMEASSLICHISLIYLIFLI